MLRFLLGCAVTAVAFWVFANRPEFVPSAISFGKEKVAVATRSLSALGGGDVDAIADIHVEQAERFVTVIDYTRVRKLAAGMSGLSWDELWQVMDEDDYDRRAAASQVLLDRAKIPVSADGVTEINRRYLRSSSPESVQSGFSYLGLLALQNVPEGSIVRLAQSYVERHPQNPACDSAIWALGELGSEEIVPYFFHIIEHEEKYGAAARERAFCCLVQCGRYSQARRRQMVPSLIRVYETEHDAQTRTWTLQALAHCAPGVHARSIADWQSWWSRQ